MAARLPPRVQTLHAADCPRTGRLFTRRHRPLVFCQPLFPMRRFLAPVLCLLTALFALPVCAADAAYLFAYFTKNGQDGLHLAWSADGYHWEALGGGRSYLHPEIGTKEKLLRDPCIARGPDGTYHLVWTSGWWEKGIGYAATRDFVHWTPQRELPVMHHEPTARNCWAPELIWDEARGEFVIFWSTTIPGRFPATAGSSEDQLDHRLYATTTRDFQSFTPTALFFDPGFSSIDATFLRTTAGRLHLVLKDETKFPQPRKHLRLAAAASPRGPFGELSVPFSPPGLWVEGPTAVQNGADILLYFDAYQTKHYGALRTRDLVHWEDVTAQMHFPGEGTPERIRHGTIIAVPRALIDALKAAPPPAP